MSYNFSKKEFIMGKPKSKSSYQEIPITQVVYKLLLEIMKQTKKIKGICNGVFRICFF